MSGFLDLVVATLKEYKKAVAGTPEEQAATVCFNEIDYAVTKGNIGNLSRIFEGFSKFTLPQDMKEQQKAWKEEYYKILSEIKNNELHKGKLKKNSPSAKRLEKLVIKILHFGYQDISQSDGSLKDELYEVFKLEEFQKKASSKTADSKEEKQTRQKIIDQLSDEEQITKAVLQGYCLYPLFNFLIEARIEASADERIASLMDNIDIGSIRSDIMTRNTIIKDQIKKQIIKLEADLKQFPTDPQDLRYSPDNPKFINISKKLECLNAALLLFKQYEIGALAGPEVLKHLQKLEKELRTEISHKAWYKRKFYINTPSESARLISSMCKHLEKYDPECKPSRQVKKKDKKKSPDSPPPRLIL